jgi:hypothetical protein
VNLAALGVHGQQQIGMVEDKAGHKHLLWSSCGVGRQVGRQPGASGVKQLKHPVEAAWWDEVVDWVGDWVWVHFTKVLGDWLLMTAFFRPPLCKSWRSCILAVFVGHPSGVTWIIGVTSVPVMATHVTPEG